MVPDSFKDFFSAQATQYAKFRPRYPEILFQWIAHLPQSCELAWDCGTGNGQAAVGLAPFFKKVLATDPSQEQLKNAIVDPKIEYRIAPAESVPFIETQSVDLVTASAAAHWFQFDPFYKEVTRVLKPKSWIALWTYGHDRSIDHPEVDEILTRFERDEVGPHWAPEIQWVREKYRSIPFPFSEVKPPEFMIQKEMNLDELLGYIFSWSATQKLRQIRQVDPLFELRTRLEKVWGAPDKTYRMTWPIYLRVGQKASS